MDKNDLRSELLKLSVDERLQLAEELWESVADEPDGPFAISEEQIKEIERRAGNSTAIRRAAFLGRSFARGYSPNMDEPLRLSLDAERELDDAVAWYDAQQEGLGRRLREAVDRAFVSIGQNPNAYPRIEGPYRRFVMRHFPYGIIYWPRPASVYVLSCFHSHRDPGRWRERL